MGGVLLLCPPILPRVIRQSIVVIGIAAIIVRRYKSRQQKNAFFDSMEDENDAENLLDDDDWANLGDWGDETFAGSNPTYDAGSSAGGDKAANEL